jgi:hypothetical protein
VENLSTAELMLVRRSAQLTLQLEMMEEDWASRGGEAPAKRLETYQRTTNTLRRTLESLGLQRRSKDVTPTLQEYLAARYEHEDADADEAAE